MKHLRIRLFSLVVIAPLACGAILYLTRSYIGEILNIQRTEAIISQVIPVLEQHGFVVTVNDRSPSFVVRSLPGFQSYRRILEIEIASQRHPDVKRKTFRRSGELYSAIAMIPDSFTVDVENSDFDCSDLKRLADSRVGYIFAKNTLLSDCEWDGSRYSELISFSVSNTDVGARFVEGIVDCPKIEAISLNLSQITQSDRDRLHASPRLRRCIEMQEKINEKYGLFKGYRHPN